MRYHQRGLALSSFLAVCVLVVFALIVSFKLVPAYIEEYTITRIFRQIASNPDFKNATAADVRAAFGRQTAIDRVEAISAQDIQVTRESGVLVIRTQYQVVIPLIGNVSLLVDFKPSSQ